MDKELDSENSIFFTVMKMLLKLCELQNNSEIPHIFNNFLKNDPTFSIFNTKKLGTFSHFNKASEIKTHALNILRSLYKHAPLAKMVQEYVADGFIIALNGYDSESWMVSRTNFVLIP